jgi:hypothetical protein
MNRRGSILGGGPGIPRWGALDEGRDAASEMPARSDPGGNGNDTNTPVESPVPPQIEAEVSEEAQQLYEEFVQQGLEPEAARKIIRSKVNDFVKSFEPDKPPRRLDHKNPYMVSGLSQLDYPMGMDVEMRMGRRRGMGLVGNPKPFRRKTRAECKAVDNIMGDTYESDAFEERERFGGGIYGMMSPGWGMTGFGAPRTRNGVRAMGPFGRRRGYGTPNWGWGWRSGLSELR